MEETKVTTNVVKQIADKMALANGLLNEVKALLKADNYDVGIYTPMSVNLPLCDLVDLAKVCRKKPEAKASWGDFTVSFSAYGCTFEAPLVSENEVNYYLEKGSVVMKGDK